MKRWIAVLAVALSGQTHAIWYKLYDLGYLRRDSLAYSVNDSLFVVGKSAGVWPVAWTEERGMFRLGPFANTITDGGGVAYKVNNAGLVACSVTKWVAGGFRNHQPATWSPTRGYKLLPMPQGSSYGETYGMSENGYIAGVLYGAVLERGFVWSESTGVQFIGRLAENFGSVAQDVNIHGEVVGSSALNTGHSRAIYWSQNTGLVNLGVLPGMDDSNATCTNDNGLIMGYSLSIAQGIQYPFYTKLGQQMQILPSGPEGTLYQPYDVNQKGQAVGGGSSPMIGQTAVTYEPGVGVIRLEDHLIGSNLGLQLIHTNGINEHGDIVGTALVNGNYRAFLAKRLD